MVKNTDLMMVIREATGSRKEAMKYDLAIASWAQARPCPRSLLSGQS